MATGIPPFFTALVGLRNIEEQPVLSENRTPRTLGPNLLYALYHGAASQVRWLRTIPARMAERRTIGMLAVFIFFWKFSPSIGYIEHSYLIDIRNFKPSSFGIILSTGSLAFLVSMLAYR
jgi:hypothetical protein